MRAGPALWAAALALDVSIAGSIAAASGALAAGTKFLTELARALDVPESDDPARPGRLPAALANAVRSGLAEGSRLPRQAAEAFDRAGREDEDD